MNTRTQNPIQRIRVENVSQLSEAMRNKRVFIWCGKAKIETRKGAIIKAAKSTAKEQGFLSVAIAIETMPSRQQWCHVIGFE